MVVVTVRYGREDEDEATDTTIRRVLQTFRQPTGTFLHAKMPPGDTLYAMAWRREVMHAEHPDMFFIHRRALRQKSLQIFYSCWAYCSCSFQYSIDSYWVAVAVVAVRAK